MTSLNWIGKEKIVNHDKEVPFRLLKKVEKYSLGKDSENLIIEGDNLEALKALMPYYVGQVKCIYIDPPYNTGNEGWVYNDRVNAPKIKEWLGKVVGSEGEDLTRHDKWLCMMYPRLKMLYELLSEDGVLFISIDDNEHCNLRQIIDEIFGEGNTETIVWKKVDPKYDKNTNAKIIKRTKRIHEYITVAYKNKEKTVFNKIKKLPQWLKEKSNPDNDPRGPYESGILSFEEDHKNEDKNSEYYYSIKTPSGRKITRQFFVLKEEFNILLNDNRIYFPKGGDGIPRLKIFQNEEKNFSFETILEGVGSLNSAKKEIAEIFGVSEDDVPFDTPKPVKLIKEIVRAVAGKDSIILDSFAGSGTTGQAVLELNKEDGGNRKFILVEMEKEIAQKITSERVRRVSKGLEGHFSYEILSEPLFNANGTITEEVSYNEFAQYIYFTETHTNLNIKTITNPQIGEYSETEYYLIYKKPKENLLDKSFLKNVKKNKIQKVVYADKCALSDKVLEEYGIVFKQIPYEVKVY